MLKGGTTGAVVYKGTLDASGGSYPGSPKNGDYYLISVAGTISGVSYGVGDWAVYNGSAWERINNQSYAPIETIVDKTDNYPVVEADLGSGKTFTMNITDPTYKTFTLPALVVGDLGKQITFVKKGTGKVIIQAGTGQTISDGSSGGTIYDNQTTETYASITLVAITTTQWVILAFDGTWTTT